MGLIRKWELEAGVISHQLRILLSMDALLAGPTWNSGVAWPASRSDYDGSETYKGPILYGSTVGIPIGINVEKLGLSDAGKILARALREFGAQIRDSGGDHAINFYAEPAAAGSKIIRDIRLYDLPKIIRVLRVLRNQSPASPNGGGTRCRVLVPEIATA